MITSIDAQAMVLKKYPNAHILRAFVYKDRDYVFGISEGIENEVTTSYFAISKTTGKLRSISPIEDISGFFKDMGDHPLKV